MKTRRRAPSTLLAATVVALAAITLTACSGIPVSGAAPTRAPIDSGGGDGQTTAPVTSTTPGQPAGSTGTPADSPVVVAPPISTREAAALDTLLINTRDLLLLAPDVARIRWNNKQTDLSSDGDQHMIDDAAAQAARFNADPVLFRDYLRAQLDASRYVQAALFKQWRDAGVGPMTLTRTPAQVQAASDSLSPQLLASLAAAAPILKTPGIRPVIESRSVDLMPTRSALSDPTRAIAIKPLLDRAAR